MQADIKVAVERILDGMQAARDWRELRYMNGRRCAGMQRTSLLRYMSAGIRRVRRMKKKA